MAILRVAPIALRVLEAGEDGGDGDAEWLLDFQAGNATGFTTLTRTFFAEVVEDGSVFDESNRGDFFIAPERFLPLVDTGPENILRLRVSGFELDDNPDDILPSTEVLIPLLGPVPFPPGIDITTTASGGGEGSPDFSYSVTWRVIPNLTRGRTPPPEQLVETTLTLAEDALTLAEDALTVVRSILTVDEGSSADEIAEVDAPAGNGSSGGNGDAILIA